MEKIKVSIYDSEENLTGNYEVNNFDPEFWLELDRNPQEIPVYRGNYLVIDGEDRKTSRRKWIN